MRIRIIRSLLCTVAVLFVCTSSFAQVGASITIAPPDLPVYEQPVCPGDGYIWTPGYWAWDGEYYWVPGTWVMAPKPGSSGLLAIGPGAATDFSSMKATGACR